MSRSTTSGRVRTGLDRLEQLWPRNLRGARAGLLTHPAAVDSRLRHAVDRAAASKQFRLTTLFGPQHGFHGHTQDNMIEWKGYRDTKRRLPVHSLYGKARKPTDRMLEGLDVLAVDLQDVGSRYYTFIWTLYLCMEAAREKGIPVVVLDRPNPIGGVRTEGPVLEPAFASFVGLSPLPVRHGLTIAEIARYFQGECLPGVQLYPLPLSGWKRRHLFSETGLPWVLPSPNMPTPETALVYPGMCLLEATNLSEGRGTTRPFELFGAPFIKSSPLIRRLEDFRLPGVHFRATAFQPTFQKYAGRLCHGAQIHITHTNRFRPFKTAVAVLCAVRELYPKRFRWSRPPYEYETRKRPIDILAGNDRLRARIDAGADLSDMEKAWQRETARFDRRVRPKYRLY